MIRRINSNEFATVMNDIADLCAHQFAHYGQLNREHFLGTWRRMLAGIPDMVLCFAAFKDGRAVGTIIGLVIPDDVTGELKAVESHWVVAPKHSDGLVGLKLLRAFEAEAKRAGAKRVICGSYTVGKPERMRTLYKRLGYDCYAEAFKKEI